MLPPVRCAMRYSTIAPAQMPKPNPPTIMGTVIVRYVSTTKKVGVCHPAHKTARIRKRDVGREMSTSRSTRCRKFGGQRGVPWFGVEPAKPPAAVQRRVDATTAVIVPVN